MNPGDKYRLEHSEPTCDVVQCFNVATVTRDGERFCDECAEDLFGEKGDQPSETKGK